MAGTTLRLFPPNPDDGEAPTDAIASQQISRELRTLAVSLKDAGEALDRIARLHAGDGEAPRWAGFRPHTVIAAALVLIAAFVAGIFVATVGRSAPPPAAPAPRAVAPAPLEAPRPPPPPVVAPAPEILPAAPTVRPAAEARPVRRRAPLPARLPAARPPVRRTLNDGDGVLEPSFK